MEIRVRVRRRYMVAELLVGGRYCGSVFGTWARHRRSPNGFERIEVFEGDLLIAVLDGPVRIDETARDRVELTACAGEVG